MSQQLTFNFTIPSLPPLDQKEIDRMTREIHPMTLNKWVRRNQLDIQFLYNENCQTCGGSGKMDCGECEGKGKCQCRWCDVDSKVMCPRCMGEGCEDCKYTGHVICVWCEGTDKEECGECFGTGKIECSSPDCEEGTKSIYCLDGREGTMRKIYQEIQRREAVIVWPLFKAMWFKGGNHVSRTA